MDYEKIVKQMIADEAISKEIATKYFPELKESEGERIRENLITFFKNKYGTNSTVRFAGFKVKDILAWLEKQGKQKYADKSEPKFKVGDVIRLKGGAAEYTIKRVTDTTYYTNGWSCGIERCEKDYELVEQKPAECKEKNYSKCYVYNLPHNDEMCEQCEFNLKKPTEWSEEDEKKLDAVCYHLTDHCDTVGEYRSSELADWLKFLKDRFIWKPSEEQMRVLTWCRPLFYDPNSKEILESLINDLKKLREE